MIKITVDSIDESQRIDKYLSSRIASLSRSSILKLINSNAVKVNNNDVKASYKLKMGDSVAVEFDPKQLEEIPKIDLPIIYEDDSVIVIDKPAGILTHSKGGFNPEPTVASFISHKIDDMKGERAGIVHRLDRATSGVIICAKNDKTHRWLQKQFSERRTVKKYIAVVRGSLTPAQAIIDASIARNKKEPKKFSVSKYGKTAITMYKVIKYSNGFSLLDLKPETGRTHQLRVHLSYIKHPIIGDELYGGEKFERMMLHAESLEICVNPGEKNKKFVSKVPDFFDTILL